MSFRYNLNLSSGKTYVNILDDYFAMLHQMRCRITRMGSESVGMVLSHGKGLCDERDEIKLYLVCICLLEVKKQENFNISTYVKTL